MTIRKGEAWGARRPRPAGLRTAADDADLAGMLAADAGAPAGVGAGDLLRTVGGPSGAGGDDADDVLALPIDVLEVRLDGAPPLLVVAHVTMRNEWWRGGFLRGPVVLAMNAEFRGRWQVAPRSHPNDGRFELLECGPELRARQRLAVRRRLHTGTHLPHPDLTARSVREASWHFARPLLIIADGRRIGRARRVEVRVRPDAATLCV